MNALAENGELELVRTTPGAYLGSCRYKLPEDLTDPVYPELFRKIRRKKHRVFLLHWWK